MRGIAGMLAVVALAGLIPGATSPARAETPPKPARTVTAPAATTVAAAGPTGAVYAHDAVGRVTGVFQEGGGGSRISYDAAGNIEEVKDLPAATLAVAQVSPPRAAAGATVTLYGTGFGTDRTKVSVSFGGGASAVPTAVTEHTATVTVPGGAAGGEVKVTVGGAAATWNGFTVVGAPPKPAVRLTGLTVADAGATITVDGSGFETEKTLNLASVNGGKVQVADATAGRLTVKLPPQPVFGRVKVVTPGGAAESAGDVVVPPAPYLAANVGTGEALRLVPGTVTTVPVSTAEHIALALFDLKPDQRGLISVSGDTLPSCFDVQVIAPDGALAVDDGSVCGNKQWELESGAAPGTYLVVVDPDAAETGKVDLLAATFADVAADVTVDGPETSLAVTTPGQRATYSFTGAAGQRVFTKLVFADGTPACAVTGRLYAPDGTELAKDTCLYQDTEYVDTVTLPAAGTYRWVLDPSGLNTGTYKITVTSVPADAAVATTVDAAAPASTPVAKAGQNGVVSFAGTAGQRVFTTLTFPSGTAACSVAARLYAPDGTELAKDTCLYQATEYMDTVELPAAGTYKWVVDPKDAWTGTVGLSVTGVPADAAATTTVDAATPASVAIAKAGQGGVVSFTGAADQRIFTKLTMPSGAPTCATAARLIAPDGTELAKDTCLYQATEYIDTLTLPAAGTYKWVLDPKDAWTGTVGVSVTGMPADAAVTTTVDAATPASVAIAKAGQGGVVSFTGAAGQRIFTKLTFPSGTPSCGVAGRLLGPDGAEVAKDTCLYQATEYVDTLTLPAAGTYKWVLDPKDAWTGTIGLSVTGVPADVAVSTTIDPATPASAAIAKPGQSAVLSFTAAAGQRIFTKLTFPSGTPSCGVTARLTAPDGTEVAKDTCLYTATEYVDTLTLPAAGTYKWVLDPKDAWTGTITLAATNVPADPQATATIGGANVSVTAARPGQNATITFTATAGQNVSVTLVDETFTATCVTARLYPPTGTTYVWSSCMSKGTVRTAVLTAGGTYTLQINPTDADTGTATYKVAAAATAAAAADPALAELDRGKPRWSYKAASLDKATLTGEVRTTLGAPLAGVTLRADGREATTGADGAFRLTGLRPGLRTLRIDGRTASTDRARYGVFDVQVPVRQGANKLHHTPYLPVLDTEYEVEIPSPTTREVVVTNPAIPGLEVRIPAGVTITDADGKPARKIGITAIPVDRTPIPMPDGVSVPTYYTVQPAGGHVIGGSVKLVYPNYFKLQAGQRVNFWHYDTSGPGWEVYGAGVVDPSGRQVQPDQATVVDDFDGAMINVPNTQEPLLSWLLKFLNSAGDPVELSTGLFTMNQTDLAVDDVLPLTVNRGYNSGDGRKRAMGIGANDLYNMYLSSRRQYQEADLNLPDGSQVHYVRISPGTGFCDGVFEARSTSPEFYKSRFHYVGVCNKGGWHLTLRNGLTYVFGDEAPLQEIRDPQGNTVRILRKYKNSFGSYIGPVTQVRSPNGFWLAYTYDSGDRVTRIEDNAGRAVTYTYEGDLLKTVTGPTGKTTTYGYDAKSRLSTVTDARDKTYLTNVYDANGRIGTQTILGEGTYTFAYTLSEDGKRVTATQVTEPGGTVRRTTYDDEGYLATDTSAVGTDQEHTIRVARDADSDLPTEVDDGLGRTTTVGYDGDGNPQTMKGTAGGAEVSGRATYNGTPYGRPDTLTDPNNVTTRLEYDTRGNPTKVTDALGRSWITTYNSQGKPLTSTSPMGHQVRYDYVDGALSEVTDPLGRKTRFVRDAANRVVETIAADGTSTRTVYDAANVVTSVTGANGGTVSFGHDDGGNLTSVTDPRGKVTSFEYDDADRLSKRTDPLGAADLYTYDAESRLKTHTDRRGKVTEYRYDDLGRITFTGFGKNGDSYESSVSSSYDDRGRLRQVTDSTAGAGSVVYDYDDLDRLIKETTAQGTVGYGYDPGGRLKSMTASGQPEVTYDYFANGLLKSLTRDALTLTYDYDPDGRLTAKTLPGGVKAGYGYDDAGQVTSIAYDVGTTRTGEVGYAYDRLGRRTAATGSLARVELPKAAAGMTYDDANRLTGQAGKTLHYDEAGNLSNDGAFTYTWNARGQLVSVSDGTVTTTLGYDPVGRRIGSTAGGATTSFRFNGNELIAQTGADGSASYFLNGLGHDETLARIDGTGQVQGLLRDALGSTMALTDGGGRITTTYGYDLFGRTTSSAQDDPNAVRWTGRVSGPSMPAGLQDNRARMYSPELRRFISEDPIGMAGGLNLYEYGLGNPVDNTDPDGAIPPQVAAAAAGCLSEGLINTVAGALLGRKNSFGDYARGFGKGCLEGALGALVFGGTQFVRFGRYGDDVLESVGTACRRSSFLPGTKVRMADGTDKPIEDVKVGDRVLATDPETGKSGPQPVVGTLTSAGAKTLVRISVDDGVLVATDNHPLWVADRGEWVRADELRAGMLLRTPAGSYARVTAVETERRAEQRVHNLSVGGPHTYYVEAGDRPVLVHNSGLCGDFSAPSISVDRHGRLTNGRYTLDSAGMDPHVNGTAGKSQFGYYVNSGKAVLDAAAYADEFGLWVGSKAKVPVSNGVIGYLGDGTPTTWINVYRNKNGFVHGSPGSPR
ncbi:RHS repeat-associated core domain-containing protein [Nonomuraea jabiensis]|uniref:RHS repeat-associated core domain-containing protein n=1 Tax=Nonomuraea jabiensis TaxID=882448 RepID=UPI003D762C43